LYENPKAAREDLEKLFYCVHDVGNIRLILLEGMAHDIPYQEDHIT
jgi:hypothetical protein